MVCLQITIVDGHIAYVTSIKKDVKPTGKCQIDCGKWQVLRLTYVTPCHGDKTWRMYLHQGQDQARTRYDEIRVSVSWPLY